MPPEEEKKEPKFTRAEAHKVFAISLFNRCWEIMGQASMTDADKDELIHAAHGSAWHWSKIGKAVNQQRAQWMISRVNCVLGNVEGAMNGARRCMEFTEASLDGDNFKPDSGLQDFDLAFATEALARAHALAGMAEESAEFRKVAQKFGEAIKDEEDRKIFNEEFEKGPWNPSAER
ncbi:MAG: hypothetical protein IT462_16190 [Planctomycetes bacterium]|nr:hypothetical protein [Planctomycetota bacterium]